MTLSAHETLTAIALAGERCKNAYGKALIFLPTDQTTVTRADVVVLNKISSQSPSFKEGSR